jgi:hypothetical protein
VPLEADASARTGLPRCTLLADSLSRALGDGGALTVTTVVAVLLRPASSVTVTEAVYLPVRL